MAFSAHQDPEQVREFESDPDTLERQASEVAQMIRQSKHFIAFTGAGISTSAGIPDYRGPQGVWTLRARGQQLPAHLRRNSTLNAVPTIVHMALVELQRRGKLKFLVSQNTDGLHRRSGFPPAQLAELHGNSNLEICKNCDREYLRDFSTRSAGGVLEHQTGRKCAVCDHMLFDTIVNFSESLPEKPLNQSFAHAKRADLCLVLGSSLTVSPANLIPENTAKKRAGKLVICNLQKTPLDEMATVRVFAKTDVFMEKLLQHLEMPIPEWVLHRWVHATLKQGRFEDAKLGTSNWLLSIAGVEPDGTPASVLSSVDLPTIGQSCASEPFRLPVKERPQNVLPIRLHFMDHYNEPPLELNVQFDSSNEGASTGTIAEKSYHLSFTLSKMDWTVEEM